MADRRASAVHTLTRVQQPGPSIRRLALVNLLARGPGTAVAARRGRPALAVVAGREIPVHGRWGPWSFGVLFHGAPADGIPVLLEWGRGAASVTLRLADRSDGLDTAPAFPLPPAGRVLVDPHVAVTRAVPV